jgi:uncharacterized membrane protein (UPF0127 family)
MAGVDYPLVLVWIARNHRVVGMTRMKPCPSGENCKLYYPPRSFRWALEVLPADLKESRLKKGSAVRLRAPR